MIPRQRSAIVAHGLVPRDRHELPSALGPDPAQRRQYAQRRMYALGVLASPWPQMTPRWNGCSGLPVTDVSRPSSTVTTRLQHEDNREDKPTAWRATKGIMTADMRASLARLNPFKTRECEAARGPGSASVYFAQGMWYLPNQTVTIVLKGPRSHPRA